MTQTLHFLSLFGIGLLALGAFTFREKGIKKGTGILFAGCLLIGIPNLTFIIHVMTPTGIDFRTIEYLNSTIYVGVIFTGLGVFWIARHGAQPSLPESKEGSNQPAQDNPDAPPENPKIT